MTVVRQFWCTPRLTCFAANAKKENLIKENGKHAPAGWAAESMIDAGRVYPARADEANASDQKEQRTPSGARNH